MVGVQITLKMYNTVTSYDYMSPYFVTVKRLRIEKSTQTDAEKFEVIAEKGRYTMLFFLLLFIFYSFIQ